MNQSWSTGLGRVVTQVLRVRSWSPPGGMVRYNDVSWPLPDEAFVYATFPFLGALVASAPAPAP